MRSCGKDPCVSMQPGQSVRMGSLPFAPFAATAERLGRPWTPMDPIPGRAALPRDPVERPSIGDGVELALRILAEGAQRAYFDVLDPHVSCTASSQDEAPDRARAVVAEQVATAKRRNRLAAVDEAAGNRATLGVAVLEHG